MYLHYKNVSPYCTKYSHLENSPNKALYWLVKNRVSITRWKHRISVRCWRSDGTSKQNLHLIIKVNKLFSFYSSWCFLKEIENMYSVSDYRVIQTVLKVWENSKKLWKLSRAARVPTAFLVLPNFHSCLYNSIETQYMFFISYVTYMYLSCFNHTKFHRKTLITYWATLMARLHKCWHFLSGLKVYFWLWEHLCGQV